MKLLFENWRGFLSEDELAEIKVKDLKKQNPDYVEEIDALKQNVDNKYVQWGLEMIKKRSKTRHPIEINKTRMSILFDLATRFEKYLKDGTFDRAIKVGKAEQKNKDIVMQWLPFVDVLIYVVSPERYRDNKAWRFRRFHREVQQEDQD